MSNILSQSEIDLLLNALSTGKINVEDIKKEDEATKVKVYDFKRPNKFSKEQLRTLNMIHEKFARLLTTQLSGYLRALVKLDVFAVEQMSFYEFINSIPNPSIIATIDMSPLKGSCLLEINPSISFSIIDRLLGGPGEFHDKPRGLTEIERIIIQKVLRNILASLKESWETLIELEPTLEGIETNSQFIQLISPNETVVVVTLNGVIGKTEGMINLCLPHIVLEPILHKLSTRYWFSNTKKERDSYNTEELKKRLKRAELPVVTKLGKAVITIRDFLSLEPNDVIQLEKKADESVEIWIHNKLKFYGQPGIYGNKMAVQITDIVEEEE